MRFRRMIGLAGFAAVVLTILTAGLAHAAIKQPPQPKHGPGGSDYSHRGMRVAFGGTGSDAWYVFQPKKPRPKRAPVAIVMHGYFEFAGYDSMKAFIRHTVRKGSIVIYPRWQTDTAVPCPGPFDIEPCISSAVSGIRGAFSFLRSRPRSVKPQRRKASYIGFSFGGIITANLANRYKALGLPKPRAVFLDDPEDSGLAGEGEPSLDDSLAGIPKSTLFQCHSGATGAASGPDFSISSCNAVFPLIGQIPAKHKDLVLTHTDDHGKPTLSSAHGVCAAGADPGGGLFGKVNAYDWNFCWKVWDALRSCAYSGTACRYALGDTRAHRSVGRWSDGKRVKRLRVQDEAPILP